jgi:hypothetical protein
MRGIQYTAACRFITDSLEYWIIRGACHRAAHRADPLADDDDDDCVTH